MCGKDCIIVGFKFVHLARGICRLFRRLLISYVRISLLLLLVRWLAHRVHKSACIGFQNGRRRILDEQIGWLRRCVLSCVSSELLIGLHLFTP